MSEPPRRIVKIIVISDYVCSFCYIANKSLHDAIDACRDLPVRFDVEFRPFTLMCSSLYTAGSQKVNRRSYLAKKFGKEQGEAKWKFSSDMAQKAGLKIAEDAVVCRSTQAHRLSAKAYQVGGHAMQRQLVSLIFDACMASGEDISSDDFLTNAAVKVGLMNKERATEFLKSTEALDCVEKMIEAARANGVNGVPFIIIDGKWAMNGVQSKDCYVQIFRKLAQACTSPSPPGLAKACNDVKDSIIAPALSVQ